MQPIRIRSNHDYGGGALMRDFVNLFHIVTIRWQMVSLL